MSYVHGIIENGESTMIVADDMVIEFNDGCITVTVDGKSNQTKVWRKETKMFYEIMKEYFDASLKREDSVSVE